MDELLLQLALGDCSSSFNMEKAVCNHGLFMMSPNVWIPSTKSLYRPLRLADSSHSLSVTVSHPPNHPFLVIKVHGVHSLPSADEAAILEQVARMLRISSKDEKDVREFQTLHASAKEKGFGRIFRSPSFFEDAVKSILLCNCGWKRTLAMAQALCELQAQMANAQLQPMGVKSNSNRKIFTKRLKHSSNSESSRSKFDQSRGNFPTSTELAYLDEKYLNKRCNLGYRAQSILQLARKIENGEIEESCDITSHDKLYQKLMKVEGFGPFVCSNIMMCVGSYKRIPSDSETIRHLKEVHGKGKCSKRTIQKDVEEIYSKLELVEEYEKKFGVLSELDSASYHLVTGSQQSALRE
ncbi:uncharacterized protein LOC111315199 [Durio zibethinus]|uniref:Uncharacterized protein LOC111315199 n=1 Tax=Durio zibethinus TaxID=66656 RepID=A0A6P6B5P3_DURZI|nr:uncharacterized protein LOC111315199 [Durio zibethinus]